MEKKNENNNVFKAGGEYQMNKKTFWKMKPKCPSLFSIFNTKNIDKVERD